MSKSIFKALTAVQADLSKSGIGKNQTNDFDKYKFRGIDDVLNVLAPILAKHGVLIIPTVKERELRQVQTTKGGTMQHAILTVDYTLYDAEGDSIVHTVQGEAFDRGDKSINKALTAAFKYFVFQAFCIPLVGQDADAESHEIAADERLKAHNEAVRDLMPTITCIKESIAAGDLSAAIEAWQELSDEEKRALWVAPSKGGIFTTHERGVMKSNEWHAAHKAMYSEAS